ncbi:MAG: excinuclease ABC subunit UvrA [Planctomycetaceae bacterium]|nr:excinuclease ABC subunit UvrA [Planctomycetaceae bacterium]
MPISDVVIRGAREHNLRNVDLVLPRNQLICLTGVSGSGKSSLAFDTVYAEGQRRYVESLSSFARHFLGQMPKPEVDYIAGLSPSISISQKSGGTNPRSTVGTITEIYDFLRVLYARIGQGFCPRCGRPITAQSREQILAGILALREGARVAILAPLIRQQKGEYRDLCEDLRKQGFARVRVDGRLVRLSDALQLDRQMRHDIEVVIDRLVARPEVRPRLAEAVEQALKLGHGTLIVADAGDEAAEATPGEPAPSPPVLSDTAYSADYACTSCRLSFEPPSPQLFSFNSPQGMCPQCDGLGQLYSFDPDLLVPDRRLSFKQGAVQLVGSWKDLGRWRRHIYQGVAGTLERQHNLADGTVLETPWSDLDPQWQHALLWGTGDQHVTFTWRGGVTPIKHGGTYDGIIPELLSKYRSSRNRLQIRQLEKYMRTLPCAECQGERLTAQARAVCVTTRHPAFQDAPRKSLPAVCRLSVREAAEFFAQLQLDATGEAIATEVLKEIRHRLGFLVNVGLDYLTLDRTAPTLSGGESQRIRLASQIGSGLVGVLYILDEPSIGLHPRDNHRLLASLQRLRDLGNTVVVVEHDEDTMRAADHLIDFGPGPGVRGGRVVASGSLDEVIRAPASVTGKYLAGTLQIATPDQRRAPGAGRLRVRDAAHNNLKHLDVEIPLGVFVCITGVSGSGKSSLVNDILVETLRRDLNGGLGEPGACGGLEGLEHLDKMIAIDQSPIGRTPRSNPGTYIKVFDDIRNLFAQLPESKLRGYLPGRFSFNVAGGRCEACEGNGSNRLEMDFLADVWVTCPVCEGHRYNHETRQVQFKGKSIADVLELDVQQALQLFENIPNVRHKLQTLHDVGLDYVKLGQPSPTLSGGEAQRIKLARELVKRSTGRTLYLLDEPTTGLHFADIQLLLQVLHSFVDGGNTVLVVEHNLEVIKTADWIIDLGPEGGAAGGYIVTAGTPEQVAGCAASHTGQALAALLDHGAGRPRPAQRPKRRAQRPTAAPTKLRVQGAQQHNLKSVSTEIQRDRMTVFCGPSGSGKTSLAMDTIYAEGQRRYVESLSAYARQFVSQMQKPRVEHIEGLSPAIAIEQKNLGHTPRSTVGTVTEIYDYLRILLARLGTPHCPACDVPVGTQTTDEITAKVLAAPEGTRLQLLAPVEVPVGQDYESLWRDVRSHGYLRMRVDGTTHSVTRPPDIDRRHKHQVEVVVDRVVVKPAVRGRIAEAVEKCLALGKGVLHVLQEQPGVPETQWETVRHNQHLACDRCGRSLEPLTPHNFSFNSPLGWCPACAGLGTQTGANPAALLQDAKRTLRDGAVSLWPNVQHPVSQWMLRALAAGSGLPLDVPFDQFSARHRRTVLHGCGDQWFDVCPDGQRGSAPLFRFQFKGLYPALEEAARLSPTLRTRLEHLIDQVDCTVCGGSRLREDAAAVRFQGKTIDQLCRLPLGHLQQEVARWKLSARDRKIAGELLREVKNRTQFLNDVGLHYLTLARGAATLSNGEAQRIRLASQLGSGLCGVLYVLDEPTIGLHPRDNARLLSALHKLRDLGNTLIVVEHDRDVIAGSDSICDFGPAAGKHGGQIVAQGTPRQIARRKTSCTGPYLSGAKAIPIPAQRRMARPQPAPVAATPAAPRARRSRPPRPKPPAAAAAGASWESPTGQWLEVVGARHNNLRDVTVRFPLGTLTVVSGPSGSGKSSLIEDVLYQTLARRLHRASVMPGAHDAVRGIEFINKVIRVDQQPLGNAPTSNPATFTGVFELIRLLFAQLPEAKVRGYSARRFSFNVPGGRCDRCEGNGQLCIEMHFLPDVWVECDTCRGKRYNPETLAVTYHGRSISDVLDMTCGEAVELFGNIPKIRRILQTLCDVGLDYLTLGQPAPTLSGGEAQRVKLAAELARPDTGRTLYLLDEPTTGLHFDDLVRLLDVLHRLVDLGNTVVLIEHNLDVIKSADWVIDMGPEAGDEGGRVVTCGTPEDLVAYAAARTARQAAGDQELSLRSYTGEALGPVLEASPRVPRTPFDPAAALEERPGDRDIMEIGRDAQMPWEVDGRRWHTQDRVGYKGEPCRWDGRILAAVIDRIQQLGTFSPTDWNSRSVVEIAAEKKSVGWFFHAITGEAWLLKMKFRVAHNTFERQDLLQRLPLKTLNQLEEVPLYGNEPRVKCRSLRGPWQEIQITAHSWAEIDTPEFWSFVEEAVAGFQEYTQLTELKLEDHMPWKKLGQRWHFLRKGFSPGKRILWEVEVWEELYELLRQCAPDGQFLWNNQVLVHLVLKSQREPWITICTKRCESLDMTLYGPKGAVTLGRIAEIARERELDATAPDRDLIRLRFRTLEDLHRGDLGQFLEEHKRFMQN